MSNNTFPNKELVKNNEFLGRRAFGDVLANGRGREQPGEFRITLFMDNRLNENQSFVDLSLDRLGVGAASKKVRRFLTPQCTSQGNESGNEFHGWAQIKKDKIKGYNIIPTPDGEINPYHADLDRSKIENRTHAETLAGYLCFLASKDMVEPIL